jgi:hypothetical protein
MSQAFAGSYGNRDRFTARLKNFGDRLLAEKGLLADLGLTGSMGEIFRRIVEYAGEGGGVTPFEIDGILEIAPTADGLTGQQVAEFGSLMGLLVPQPLRTSDGEDLRQHVMNPLAAALLNARPVEAA